MRKLNSHYVGGIRKPRAIFVGLVLIVGTIFSLGKFGLKNTIYSKEAEAYTRSSHKRNATMKNTVKSTENLLTTGIWEHQPGISKIDTRLIVEYVGMAIVEQDGSKGVMNPPVNLYGTRFDLKGSRNFDSTFTLQDLKGEAGITLYGKPPIILDEERVEPPSMRVVIKKDSVWCGIYDGKTNELMDEKVFGYASTSNEQLTISHYGSVIRLVMGGKPLGQISDHGIFSGGQLWYGFDAVTPESRWVISGLTITGGENSTVTMINTAALPLVKQLPDSFQSVVSARGDKTVVGAAVSLEQLVSDPRYRELALGMYGGWTTENALKMQFVQPQRGVYTFGPADALFDIAEKNNIKMHLHTLVFGEANPAWVQDLARSNPEQLRWVMLDHIKTVVSHYQGKAQTIDVVNEPLADYDNFERGSTELRNNIWYNAMGEEYIDLSFRQAHESDPNALLFMNEFGLEGSEIDGDDYDRWEVFLELIDRMRAKGTPIDGIGFQAHVYENGDEVVPAVFRSRIKQLQQRGLVFRISEADVYADNGRLVQTQEFAILAAICKEFKSDCIGISTWGISDRYASTGYINDNSRFEPGDGLLFDTNQRAVLAAEYFRAALK